MTSRIVSKRKVRVRKCRAPLSLLPEGEFEPPESPEATGLEHILLPAETEKLEYKNARGKWHEPLFPPPKSSNYLINGKGQFVTHVMSRLKKEKMRSNLNRDLRLL